MIETKIYQRKDIKEAAMTLNSGGLVAFPTETVFGLGAVANQAQAIQKVYQVKGRPGDNPLIVHVDSPVTARKYAKKVTPLQEALMEAFWPGPLTIIFEVNPGIFAHNVNGSMGTVAMRMPNQMETLLLIKMVGFPLVGPSANLSGKPSPTKVDHVLHDFQGLIEGVIDPQRDLTDIGVESTVVRVEDGVIYILRPGAVTKEMLIDSTGVKVVEVSQAQQLAHKEIQSPGVKYKHYSPKQPVMIIPDTASMDDWKSYLDQYESLALLADQRIINQFKAHPNVKALYCLGDQGDIISATRNLYAGLRELEDTESQVIFAQSFPPSDGSQAYLNRLYHAGELIPPHI